MHDEVGKLMELEVEMDASTLVCGMPRGTPYKAGRWKQFKTLLWRAWIASIREPAALWVRLIQIAVSTNLLFATMNLRQVSSAFSVCCRCIG